MKRERRVDLVLLLVTVVSGIAAAGLAYAYLEKRLADQRRELSGAPVRVVEAPELRSVVVMRRDLYRGERIAADDLTVLRVPTEGLTVEGVLVSPQQAVGQVALQPLFAGEWLIARKLAAADATGDTWNALLEPGRRAIRVPVDSVSGLLGIVEPGDRVDLIAVFPAASDGRMVSRAVEQNLAVLAVGQRRVPQPDAGDPAQQTTTVTLDVDHRQAERIALALQVGDVQLVLRSRTDTDVVRSAGVNTALLERDGLKAPTATTPPRHVVEVLSGSSVAKETVTR